MLISVIIPTLDEESCLGETLQCLSAENPHEIVVVDGGSSDSTCRIASSGGCSLLQGVRGRAAQMNLGAAHATGDALLFLHADCSLQPGALSAAARVLARGVAAGCFRMTVTASGLLYRVIDACATMRVRATGIIYGDQGMFVARERFLRLGGFPEVRLMEDVLMSLKLRKQGQVVVVPSRIFVSPRRWQRQGIVRQTLRNWTLTALAAAGVHPDRLARYYPVVRVDKRDILRT